MSSELRDSPIPGEYEYEPLPPVPIGGGPSDVLAEAWAQAEQIREQARAAGEAEGRAAGLASAHADVEQALGALTGALSEFENAREQLLAAIERDAVELAFQLGEQILAGALAARPESVVDVGRNALRRLTDRHRVTLVAHPADLELLSGAAPGLRAELGGIEHCEVQVDRRIGRGGVVVRTDAGEVDATIELGLRRAREAVAAALAPEADAG